MLGTNFVLSAVGGTPDRTFVAFTSTNVTAPLTQWSPFLTNQFNRLGVFSHTNRFDVAEPRRFFTTREE